MKVNGYHQVQNISDPNTPIGTLSIYRYDDLRDVWVSTQILDVPDTINHSNHSIDNTDYYIKTQSS